ncbi:MAG: uroporphyrinogen decarboxylase [Gammaproteobacteria bacterium]|nr:uroporphyrinogen decarboxylase [Gammaproteobacteria bacterium]
MSNANPPTADTRAIEDPQQARLAHWQSMPHAQFASPEAAARYRARAQRFVDIVRLKQPDRVPTVMSAAGILARFGGISFADTFYDAEKTTAAMLRFVEDYAIEYTYMIGASRATGPAYDLLGYGAYKWPGGSLPADVPFQYVEDEYMPAEDYDALIGNPEGYMLRSYLPRVCTQLQGLRQIPNLVAMVEMLGVSIWLGALSAAPIQQALARISQAIAHLATSAELVGRTNAQLLGQLGCPSLIGGVSKAPFDIVADTLRGTRSALMDLYRRPGKLLAACDALVPSAIHMGVGTGQPGPPPFVFMPLHKGADAFMSFRHFEKFYWPSFQRVLEGIIAAGMVPLPFVEGSFDEARLALIASSGLPAGRTVWLFDRSDLKLVRKHFGGFACFGGNVPVSLFRAGTPRQMEDHCRQLIEEVAGGGGYFLAPGAPVDEAEPEVVRAFLRSAEKFGVY